MSDSLSWGMGPTQFFFSLTPDRVMESIEKFIDIQCTGYCMALASFENRVYEIEYEPGGREHRTIAKFYRPGRWSLEQIQEEHDYLYDLLEAEIPVIAPESEIYTNAEGIYFSLFPKMGGRQPEDLKPEQLQRLGRLIARMHSVGVQKKAQHRIELSPQTYGQASFEFLNQYWAEQSKIDPEIRRNTSDLIQRLIKNMNEDYQKIPLHRIHGDCHPGNLLWNEKLGPFFIDFDDMVVGPAVQDLWLLSPDPHSIRDLLEGYHQIRDLPQGSLPLIEHLRALRMIHYTTWVAKRFDDPAFQNAFPHFGTQKYWQDFYLDLRGQEQRIHEIKWGSGLEYGN